MSGNFMDGQGTESTTSSVYRMVQRFEQQWHNSQGDKRPKIEDFLPLVAPEERADVLTKLLSIELPSRSTQRVADFPTLAEYVARFPQFEQVVAQAFDDWPIDNYVLLSKLGEGGMGQVYKARRAVMNDLVAIKVMLDGGQERQSLFERFQREIRAVAQLVHPNIVRALDGRRLRDGHLILIMELVDGVSLGKLSSSPLPVPAACEAVRQAALALDFAHSRGVIHRDVKPDNLMVTPDGVVKLLDLGLAKLKQEDAGLTVLTGGQMLLGTPEFMAPEQWKSASEVDPRVDVYALGCVLFQLLVGFPPWHRKQFTSPDGTTDYLRMQEAICQGPPRRLDNYRVDVPLALVGFVNRSMECDPAKRMPSCAAFATALEEWADRRALAKIVAEYQVSRTALTEPLPLVHRTPHSTHPDSHTAQPTETQPSGTPNVTPAASSNNGAITALTTRLPRLTRRQALVLGSVVGGAGILGLGSWSWQLRPDPKQALAKQEIATFPGLYGAWWFDETPWFTPAVRQALVNRKSRSEIVALQGKLLGADDNGTQKLYDRLVELTHEALHDCSEVQNKFSEYCFYTSAKSAPPQERATKYGEIFDGLRKALGQEDRPAVDWHLGAILLHLLANLGQPQRDHQTASDWYEAARRRYIAEGDPIGLERLAAADLAKYWTDAKRLDDARTTFGKAILEHEREGILQLLPLWLETSAYDAFVVNDVKRARDYAQKAVSAAKNLETSHPLRAYAKEVLAWGYVDGLNFQAAVECFNDALKTRHVNDESASYRLHDKHGLALCQYFQGDVDGAIQELQQLVKEKGEIPFALKGRVGSDWKLVAERWPNSWERLGDCYLFGKQDYANAVSAYDAAMDRGEDVGWDKGGMYLELYAAFWYRKIMALARQAEVKPAEVLKQWVKLQEWTRKLSDKNRLLDQADIKVRRLMAEAMAKMCNPKTTGEGLAALYECVVDRKNGRDDFNRIRRDDLGPMLIGAQHWMDTLSAVPNEDESERLVELLKAILRLHESAIADSPKFGWFFSNWKQAAERKLAAIPELFDKPMPKSLYEKISKLQVGS